MAGSRLFASSVITLENKKKVFLTTTFSKLKELMNDSSSSIVVVQANLISDFKVVIKKEDISSYKKTNI